jgi:hypothetical protein
MSQWKDHLGSRQIGPSILNRFSMSSMLSKPDVVNQVDLGMTAKPLCAQQAKVHWSQ